MTSEEKIKRIALLKETKERHEEIIKLINIAIEKLAAESFKYFAEKDLNKLEIAGNLFSDLRPRTVSPILVYKPSVSNVDKFHEWLRANGHGSLIKEAVHYKTLESFVKKQKKANKALPEETTLKIFTLESVKIRRSGQAEGDEDE